ncbi:hypothetical protein [Lewinella sp. W8]|uniref:hypothetical protein n=1 Tax=Lewinella sp. W8 TaxID=2528208 RepID=UPI001068A726|nr:hypothetical protein [Lewinella sp. W8]MTB51871.1 hypothetical protein [Lewinella sp. W8]
MLNKFRDKYWLLAFGVALLVLGSTIFAFDLSEQTRKWVVGLLIFVYMPAVEILLWLKRRNTE